jgi:hypothetical protein
VNDGRVRVDLNVALNGLTLPIGVSTLPSADIPLDQFHDLSSSSHARSHGRISEPKANSLAWGQQDQDREQLEPLT